MRKVAVCCALIAVASPLSAQTPADSALARQLGAEVRQFIQARPNASNPSTRDENGSMADLLVRLQIQSRDLGAALETATLSGTMRSFQWIADEHRKSGDREALIRTISASRDREELGAWAARIYVISDSLDGASRVVAVMPPTYMRRQLEAEIAVARVGHGDWSALQAMSLMQFAPVDRVDLLSRLGEVLRKSNSPRLDSIARLADEALAHIADATEREVSSTMIDMRIRGRTPTGMVRTVSMNDGATIVTSAEIDTATKGPARVQALRNQAITEARRDRNFTAALKTLADPVVVADTISLVRACSTWSR
jgi:hypothetical protein